MAGLYHTVYSQVKATISLYFEDESDPSDFLNDLGFGFTFQQCFVNFLGYDYTTSITSGKARKLEEKAPYSWTFNNGKDEYLFWPKEGVEIHLEVVKDLFGHRYVKSRKPRIISSKPIDTQIADTKE